MGLTAATLEMGKRSLVVGLGKTGLSCARHLAGLGGEVVVVDSREQPPALAQLRAELPNVPVHLGGFAEAAFASVDQLVVSPGVSLKEPAIAAAVARGVPVLGDIELFARRAQAQVIAITGSNGKSTVTTLVAAMAQRAGTDVRAGGNLGIPALELMFMSEPDLYILELSSFQLETTQSLRSAAAVVLNVSPDHMDRYTDLDDYANAKARIYADAAVKVVNSDDPVVTAMAGENTLRFTLATPGPGDYGLRREAGGQWLARGERLLLPAQALRIPGRHNLANALAALALAEAVGLPEAAVLETLRSFEGLPHRTQWVAERDGVAWYNDSKGTNVGATLAALGGMPGKAVLIAGGDGKGADFSPLRQVVKDKARAVVLIGRDAPLIEAALAGAAPVLHAADMAEAVTLAREAAQSGDAVLLSPACASFDMYSGYEERGEVFMATVKEALA